MVTLITSLNADLYGEYGRAMISSFDALSKDVSLLVMFEGEIPAELIAGGRNFAVIPIETDLYHEFRERFDRVPKANGVTTAVVEKNGAMITVPSVSYRFHLVKFSFKIFALVKAREMAAFDEAFAWIDADVRCLKPFSAADLQPFMPQDGQLMSYLGRTRYPPRGPHSECGFLGFNPSHPQLETFLSRMLSLYTTGEAMEFREWHDSWLWDEVRREFEQRGVAFRNISGVYQDLEHPFINSGLGQFFDHLKGPGRKLTGHSSTRDYAANAVGVNAPRPNLNAKP